MRVKLDVSPGLSAVMATEIKAGQRAVKRAAVSTGRDLKNEWRGQIVSAGLGRRLANSIREETFPRGRDSFGAATFIWSNAPKIISAHDRGITIRSSDGFYLAIPTEAAGASLRGGRITPKEWERRRGLRLHFVFRRGAPSLLVAEGRLNSKGRAVESRSKTGRGRTTVPIFVLVRQVSLRKRLDLNRATVNAEAALPGRIVDQWVSDRTGE